MFGEDKNVFAEHKQIIISTVWI